MTVEVLLSTLPFARPLLPVCSRFALTSAGVPPGGSGVAAWPCGAPRVMPGSAEVSTSVLCDGRGALRALRLRNAALLAAQTLRSDFYCHQTRDVYTPVFLCIKLLCWAFQSFVFLKYAGFRLSFNSFNERLRRKNVF